MTADVKQYQTNRKIRKMQGQTMKILAKYLKCKLNASLENNEITARDRERKCCKFNAVITTENCSILTTAIFVNVVLYLSSILTSKEFLPVRV